jgi:hypothetical protein
MIQDGRGMSITEDQGELLSDLLPLPTSLLGIPFILDLLLQQLFDYVLESDNADFFKDRIRDPQRVLGHLRDDSHLEFVPLEKLQDRLEFGTVVDRDNLTHENARKLLQGRQVVINVRENQVP